MPLPHPYISCKCCSRFPAGIPKAGGEVTRAIQPTGGCSSGRNRMRRKQSTSLGSGCAWSPGTPFSSTLHHLALNGWFEAWWNYITVGARRVTVTSGRQIPRGHKGLHFCKYCTSLLESFTNAKSSKSRSTITWYIWDLTFLMVGGGKSENRSFRKKRGRFIHFILHLSIRLHSSKRMDMGLDQIC